MTKKERAQMIVERLEQVYPEGICSLDYKKPHELMIAGRLSAQCTDASSFDLIFLYPLFRIYTILF